MGVNENIFPNSWYVIASKLPSKASVYNKPQSKASVYVVVLHAKVHV